MSLTRLTSVTLAPLSQLVVMALLIYSIVCHAVTFQQLTQCGKLANNSSCRALGFNLACAIGLLAAPIGFELTIWNVDREYVFHEQLSVYMGIFCGGLLVLSDMSIAVVWIEIANKTKHRGAS